MKKLYTLALAAAVAVSASAAIPGHAFEKNAVISQFDLSAKASNAEKIIKAHGSDIKKAPSNAPASLDGKMFVFSYGLKMGEVYDELSSLVEFTFLQNDPESGYDFYTMTGLLEGVFGQSITIKPQTVAYSNGELVLPVGQEIAVINGNKCVTWNRIDDGYLYSDIDFYFEWDGKHFEWAPSQEFETQAGNVTFTSVGASVGFVTENDRIGTYFNLDKFAMYPVNGDLNFTMTSNGQSQEIGSYLAVSVEEKAVIIRNFADMTDIMCTLDLEAKTITAKDAYFGDARIGGTENDPVYGPAYVSAATHEDGEAYNANGDGVYELVMTFTVADGKTTVNMPDWNVFVKEGNEDYPCFSALITKSSMTFDFDITAATDGISNIVADDANAPVEYFNLQGVRVANPENGLYIRRQGNKAQKVLVK